MFIPVSILIPIEENQESMLAWMQLRRSQDELDGMLEIPGGKIEKGESPIQAAGREFREEVGIRVEENDIKQFSIFPYQYANGKEFVFYLNYFFCDKYPEVKEKLNVQVLEWDHSNLGSLNIPAANKEFLKQFLSFRSKQIR